MIRFYVLEIGAFTQYKYAWYEVTEPAKYSDKAPQCPKCGRPIGMLRWLPPHEVDLKQPRKVGDFVYGAGGSDFLISDRFLAMYQEKGLSGIEQHYPVSIRRMGTTRKSASYTRPTLFGVELLHTTTRVDYGRMRAAWDEKPSRDYCRFCGPGGGGKGGCIRSIKRTVVQPETWTGHDLFYAINFSGSVLLSEKGRRAIQDGGYENVKTVPCDEYKFSFGKFSFGA